MKVYYVMFKWQDFNDDTQFETKEFESLYKAIRFMEKIKRETRYLIKKYTRMGIYNPFYDISLVESEKTNNGRRKNT